MLSQRSIAQLAADLLAEWEQRMVPKRIASDEYNRPLLLSKLTNFCYATEADADVNVDTDDLQVALHAYSSHRLGHATASGPGRALRLAHAALADAQHWLLGPFAATPCNHILLFIKSHPAAELEMDELTAITQHVQVAVENPRAEITFGHSLHAILPMELQLHLLLSYGRSLPALLKTGIHPTLKPEEILPEAMRLIAERRTISGSLLQRRLGLGYNYTCQLLKELETAGVIRKMEIFGYEVITA